VATLMWPLLNLPFFIAGVCIILATARHKELARLRRVWQIAFEGQEKIYSKFAEGRLLRSAKACHWQPGHQIRKWSEVLENELRDMD
jgi:hypothetical protein